MDEEAIHMLHACLRAQGAMLCALARAHSRPDELHARFDEEARQSVLLAHAEGAHEEWVSLLRQMMDQFRAHIGPAKRAV